MKILNNNELMTTTGGISFHYNVLGYSGELAGVQAVLVGTAVALPASYLAGEGLILAGQFATFTGHLLKVPAQATLYLSGAVFSNNKRK